MSNNAPTGIERPTTIDSYKKWLKIVLGYKIDQRTEKHYTSVALLLRSEFEKTEFWKYLKNEMVECEDTYRMKMKGYPLLMSKPEDIRLELKEYDSFLLKSARKNISENQSWPEEPETGWITPKNWFSRINDIVRTTIVVKYLDGVSIVVDRLREVCGNCGVDFEVDWEAREEGYYAAHAYVKKEYNIPTLEFKSELVPVKVEFQVITQLQEVIRRLTHRYYEERRKRLRSPGEKWQWNYESDEFIPNYLGHILHYVEGMIMGVRKKELKE